LSQFGQRPQVHLVPVAFQRIPPNSQSDRSKPHDRQRTIHSRDSASIDAAHFRGVSPLTSLWIQLMAVAFLVGCPCTRIRRRHILDVRTTTSPTVRIWTRRSRECDTRTALAALPAQRQSKSVKAVEVLAARCVVEATWGSRCKTGTVPQL